ncbi:hypothetical protein L218DRAFT_223788 [Marasmius fiardii PR-910]|nr:hypothetical protein L218DRAFT_223788 [Marasmius fiardii PR-910]
MHTLVVLLFRLKLVQVHISHHCYMKDFLEEVLYSGKYDIPPEIETIMRPYKPRNLRFFTPKNTFPIHDFTSIPNVEDFHDLIWVDPNLRTTEDCRTFSSLRWVMSQHNRRGAPTYRGT